jgi:hypothetical protein
MSGWIKLHRDLLDWEWYDHTPTKVVFLHCLLKANYSDKEWRGKLIKRGEFVTSLQKLSDETGFSVKKIRTILGKLKGKELAIKSTSQHTVIQVVKYDDYQAEASEGQAEGQSKDKPRATTEEEEEEKKEEITPISPEGESDTPAEEEGSQATCFSFDEFWEAYGKKTDRKTAKARYKKISEEDRAKIKENLPAYVASTPNKQFRKGPAVYLNKESWNDEIELELPEQPKSATKRPEGMSYLEWMDSLDFYNNK